MFFSQISERSDAIAIYHFNVSVVSRGKNASAVAKAAYISGEKIKNDLNGKISDYRRKSEIVHKEIILPSNAPPKFKKRSVLWNEVEFSEKRKNSQTARHINAALPVELSLKEQIDLVQQFCKQSFVSKGMCVDFAIHDKHDGNPHVHILLTTAELMKMDLPKKTVHGTINRYCSNGESYGQTGAITSCILFQMSA